MTTTTPKTGLRALPRNVWATALTSFFADVSSDMIFNLLPLFLVNVLGVRTPVIGLIEGIAESAASLLKIFSGWLSDRLGRRKRLAVIGYGLSALAKPLLYVTTAWSGVLFVRTADRVGKGIRTAPRDALIADSIDERHRGLAFGVQRAGDTFGAFTGLAIALGIVLATQAQSLILTRETFQIIVLVGSVPAVLAVVALAFGAREVAAPASARSAPRLTLAGLPPTFRRFLGIVVIFTLGNSADAFLILRAQERGMSVPGVLAMLMTFNLIYAFLSSPAGALSDRLGRRRVIALGWGVYALMYLGFALATETWHMWGLYALYGVYYAAFEGTAKAFIADLVPAETRATAYGAYSAAVGLVVLPASLIAGILWQGIGGWMGFGASAPFVFGAALALLALLLLSRLRIEFAPPVSTL
jgi:MFS family permease